MLFFKIPKFIKQDICSLKEFGELGFTMFSFGWFLIIENYKKPIFGNLVPKFFGTKIFWYQIYGTNLWLNLKQ